MNHIYQTASAFEELCAGLRDLIKRSKYKVRAIIDALDMADATFYQKMRENRWTAEEIKKIAPMLAEQQGG